MLIESLESRRLLHDATLVDGVLTLEGVDGENDELRVSRIGDIYRAEAINDGFTQDFPADQVRFVSVVAGTGDDSITLVDVNVRSTLSGDAGNDTISGGLHRDVINGGEGNDVLSGNGERDQLFGDAGNDTLSGGSKIDTLTGGDGADLLVGGAGTQDMVSYSDAATAVSISIDDIANDGRSGENDNIAATIEAFLGGSGNDFIRGSGKDNRIIGAGGDDTLIGGGGSDTIQGNLGDDSIEGQGGNDLLYAAGETGGDSASDIDTLVGGSGVDTAIAGAEDTVLSVP